MQLVVSQSSQKLPPPVAGAAALGINTKSADKIARSIPKKPRPVRVSGKPAATQSKKILLTEEDKKRAANRRFRHYLAYRQRKALYEASLAGEFHSLTACGAFAVPAYGKNKETGETWLTGSPGEVQLTWQKGQDGKSRLVHSWVKRCASPLICFVCAPKIRYFRSKEVQKVCRQMHEEGYCWLFMTFTAPHDLNSDPVEQVKLFQEAKRVFNQQYGRDFKDYWGLRFSIRAVEMTDDAPGPGRKSGCHFHHHEVCFFERGGYVFSDEEIAEMREFLSKRWVNSLVKVGLCTEEKREAALKWAFRLDVPRRPQKISEKDLQAVGEYLGKGASMEMTPSITAKQGRKSGVGRRISHWDVMRLAFTTETRLVPRALAIMRALRGRAWLTFSKGLREHCGLQKDLKDEEILKEKLGYFVESYDEDEWRDVDRVKAQDVLQEAINYKAQEKGIDLNKPPIDPEDRRQLDDYDPVVFEIRLIAKSASAFIAQTSCDPVTGEDLTVDPRSMLPLVDP